MSDNINPEHYKRLPAEAIEIIEAAIDKAPSNQDAYLHGQVLKYVLRCWNKNGIEDLKKAKWYLDRLIKSFETHVRQKEADLQSLKDHPFGKLKEPAIKQSLTPDPPDGWRWLEVGEIFRKGDTFDKFDTIEAIREHWVGTQCVVKHVALRRNRFEVGEKVVRVFGECVYEIIAILDEGHYEMKTPSGYKMRLYAKDLAPYIEETT